MNQFRIENIHTWKCNNETPCIAILNKQKCLFSKKKDRKVEQVLSAVGTNVCGKDKGG
jgi:hypothetical protein